MYEPQHLFDLQDNLGNAGTDPKSWLSGADGSHHLTGSSPSMLQRTHSSLSNASASASANVDHFLYKEFAEILPLIQSLIDVKQNTKFTRRGSMIYTKTPSRESHARKDGDSYVCCRQLIQKQEMLFNLYLQKGGKTRVKIQELTKMQAQRAFPCFLRSLFHQKRIVRN